jgi:hypothetical protein
MKLIHLLLLLYLFSISLPIIAQVVPVPITIIHEGSGKCLTLNLARFDFGAAGHTISIAPCNNGAEQTWYQQCV